MDISSKNGLKKITNKYNIYPHKKWGQNFLIDKNILNKIADLSTLNSEDYVLEIGPGLGALTKEIARRSKGVLAIEIDSSLQEGLKETLSDTSNTYLKFADFLKVDIEKELAVVFKLEEITTYKICANIPYNITTPIIFKILENCPHMDYAVLMIQKEVALRINAVPGTKEYGLLTIMIQYYADVQYLMDVSKNCFFPRPEVDSAVIRIIPHKKANCTNEKIFKTLVKKAFQMRRKTMLNICSDIFREDKETIKKYLEQINIEAAKRPENLTICDFIRIADNLPVGFMEEG